MLCTKCGSDVENGFCQSCGSVEDSANSFEQPTFEMPTCDCGNSVSDSDGFCVMCGALIVSPHDKDCKCIQCIK